MMYLNQDYALLGLSADDSVGVRVAESSQRRPETQSRIYEASSGGGRGEQQAEEGWQCNGGGKGGRRRRNVGRRRNGGTAAAKKRGEAERCSADGVGVHERRSAAQEEKTAQRRRRTIARSGCATRGVVGVRCKERREPAESRSTSTMTVDDDGDGGGEDCAAAAKAKRVCRERGRGGWVSGFTLFMLRQIIDISSLSLIVCR
ncbi:hypothetical protein Scep_019141 [Stephania cephalantha]|uniref:Uncharacterized protein n=1 Tax=Stephania cephalantha TaxID=152367 RepID=A0AAP0NL07_9MAGN